MTLREALRQRTWLLAAGLVLLAAGALGTVAARRHHGDPADDASLDRDGATANAPLTAVDPVPGPDGAPAFRLSYEFLDIPGAKHSGSAVLTDPQRVKSLERQGVLTIQYLPLRPDVHRLEGTRRSTMPAGLAQGLLATAALGLALFAAGLAAAALTAWRAPAGAG